MQCSDCGREFKSEHAVKVHQGRSSCTSVTPLHGTVARARTCKCRECRDAKVEYVRQWRQDNPEQYEKHVKTMMLKRGRMRCESCGRLLFPKKGAPLHPMGLCEGRKIDVR